jgi:hypothetical protein
MSKNNDKYQNIYKKLITRKCIKNDDMNAQYA